MAEQPPAAGTPPANPPAGGQEHQPPTQNEFIMNQEQFNARWGAKHGEIEKELGQPVVLFSLKRSKIFLDQ